MRLEEEELEELLLRGESDRVERKETLGGSAPVAIRQAVCAFANDLPGHSKPGVVFVGVKDQGGPTGLTVSDDLLRQLADIKTDGSIVPPPSMSVEKRSIQGAEVAVVTVLPSDSPPVRFKGVIHIRTGTRKDIATAQDERILNERRRHGDRPFDLQPYPSATLRDLNIVRFEEEYLPNAFSPEILEANDRSIEQRLSATKMIVSADDPTPTVLGLLVLGRIPRDYIPASYIQFLRIDGVDLADPIVDSDEIDGTVPDILRRIDERIKAHNHHMVDLVRADIEQRRDFYPLAALQQFIRNAVMHRTYEATHAPVRLTWFKDRIEVYSPGGPFGTVTAQNFGRPGVTDYRNPSLAEAMKVLGYVQRFGVGIPTAKRLLATAGHPPPKFDVSGTSVLVTVTAGPS